MRLVFPKITILLCCLAFALNAKAQIVITNESPLNTDSIRKEFDKQPYFGLYKDNYFIFGTSIGPKPTKENTNVKFQVSISQKLTKSTLPWNTYLFLFYTQKCFWNVIQDSMPMTDLNFNPGIGLAKMLYVKDRFIGKLILMVEHESNGKDGYESRSWERISLAGNIMVMPQITVHGKIWIPIIDGKYNKDLLDYCGIWQMGVSAKSLNEKMGLSVILTKRKGFNLNFNTSVELCYRFSNNQNQYFFVQYYNGYGEGLLDYNKFHSQLRVGIVIKPKLFSDY